MMHTMAEPEDMTTPPATTGLPSRNRQRRKPNPKGLRSPLGIFQYLVMRGFAALDKRSLEKVIVALEREREQRGIVLVTHYLPEALSVDGVLNLEPVEHLHRGPLEKDRHIGGQGMLMRSEDEPILLGDLL